MKDFFQDNNMFQHAEKGINFDKFKKTIFPHLYQAEREDNTNSDNENKSIRKMI